MDIKSIGCLIKSSGLRKCIFNMFSVLVSDVYVVSYMRCGQTWLRMMLIKVLCLKYGFKTDSLETQFMTIFRSAPNVFFTHSGSTIKCFHDKQISKFINLYKGKKIILLVRDPKDTIVSSYHDFTKRRCKILEEDPYQGSVSDFIRDKGLGIEKPIRFMNIWAEEMEKRKDDFLLIRYEDLKKNTAKELRKVFDFLKVDVSDEIISKAVKFGSFDNMRKMELERVYQDNRMLPVDIKDVNSYRARKGKVGSYKEELCKKDIEYIENYVSNRLNPVFGYVPTKLRNDNKSM